MLSRSLFILATLVATLLSTGAGAQQNPAYQDNVHYVTLDQPVRVRDGDKIEVMEIFWYGCHHCYTLEAPLEAWASQVPADVDFRRSPVVWNAVTELHARAFYVAQALGMQPKMHEALFKALNVDRNPLNTQGKLKQFFVEHGADGDAFDKAFDSFGVNSQVNQAKARMLSYKVQGTPTLVVNGKYRVTGQGLETQAEQLQVVDYLVAKEREAQAKDR